MSLYTKLWKSGCRVVYALPQQQYYGLYPAASPAHVNAASADSARLWNREEQRVETLSHPYKTKA